MEKSEAKKLINEVKNILNEWDFIGVLPFDGGPDDEYDCMQGELVHLVQRKADKYEIKSYMIAELRDHFGLNPDHYSQDGLQKTIDKLLTLENKI